MISIWNILAIFVVRKTDENGKSYTRAFKELRPWHEAQRLLFYQHHGSLHGSHARAGGCD